MKCVLKNIHQKLNKGGKVEKVTKYYKTISNGDVDLTVLENETTETICSTRLITLVDKFNSWLENIEDAKKLVFTENSKFFRIEATFYTTVTTYTIWKWNMWDKDVRFRHEILCFNSAGNGKTENRTVEEYYTTAETFNRLVELLPYNDLDSTNAYFYYYYNKKDDIENIVRVTTVLELNYVS